MFALGAQHATNGQSEHYMDVAKGLAETCHMSYQSTGRYMKVPLCSRVSNVVSGCQKLLFIVCGYSTMEGSTVMSVINALMLVVVWPFTSV